MVGLEGRQPIGAGGHSGGQRTDEGLVVLVDFTACELAVDENEAMCIEVREDSGCTNRVGWGGTQCQLLDPCDAGVPPAFVARAGITELVEGAERSGFAAGCHVDLACGSRGLDDPLRQGRSRGQGRFGHACGASAPTIQS